MIIQNNETDILAVNYNWEFVLWEAGGFVQLIL